jgi:hypothetical protein
VVRCALAARAAVRFRALQCSEDCALPARLARTRVDRALQLARHPSEFVHEFLTALVVDACLRASYLADDRSLDIAFNDDLESEATARIWELSTLDYGLAGCGLFRLRCARLLRACLRHRSHLSCRIASLSMSSAHLQVEQWVNSISSFLVTPRASSTA